ncbi:hypothetical protein [Streptomyces phaeochromogenes]|uniref:hypothetical protein n=1 Tax=Streptomyces phaeochromogenes TaxID=1923 RepID=UPI002E13A0D7|nr:hypothetical protein [Streptomyces phaeochromogenes]WSJ08705.1 hypothetical protein OG437_36325 [Streptomyces phaeochromogenes]
MDDSLSFESFLEGAKKSAHRAMDDHGRGDYDEFALHGGVAVERLVKAVLVSKNPVYLLEMRSGSPDMLLYLGGHLEMSADKVRTVGAKDAIKRLRTLGLLPPDPKLDLLIELRNGTAHTSGGDQAKALLPALAETVAALLESIGLPMDDFWGRWTSAVYIAVDKQRDEVERDVEIRIRQAWHRFSDRFTGLPEGAMEKVLQEPRPTIGGMVMGPISITSGEDLLAMIGSMTCPACGGRAQVKLTPVNSSSTGAELIPESLRCHLCALELNSPDEMRASGTDIQVAGISASLFASWGRTLPSEVEFGETHAG